MKSIIVFGSTIYMGRGRDIDLIVIIDKLKGLAEKQELEYTLMIELMKKHKDLIFDVHVMDIELFRENLVPGTFLSGLALGYTILYDEINIEKQILDFLNKLSREKYILHNKYGSWDLSKHARIMLRLKSKSRMVQ